MRLCLQIELPSHSIHRDLLILCLQIPTLSQSTHLLLSKLCSQCHFLPLHILIFPFRSHFSPLCLSNPLFPVHSFKLYLLLLANAPGILIFIFTNINYVDSSENYDLFCEYNKENEKRRALSSFFSICAELEIIDKTEIEKIILDFIEQIKVDISKENKVNHIAELVENISIMITSGKIYLCESDNWDNILNSIEYFSNLNPKKYPSLNSKMVFKFMDLHDELEED